MGKFELMEEEEELRMEGEDGKQSLSSNGGATQSANHVCPTAAAPQQLLALSSLSGLFPLS